MITNLKSQPLAVKANILALICAGVSFLTFAIALCQTIAGHRPSIPPFDVMVCALPVTIVCSTIALLYLGFRHSKLALIGIGIFALQFFLGFIADMMILMHQ
jgi:hypothetical protein